MPRPLASLAGLGALAFAALLGGCTRVGVWLYQEPRVTLHEIRLETGVGADPFAVVLDVRNPNDFPITIERVETAVTLNNREVGRVEHAEAMELSAFESRKVSLPVPIGDESPEAFTTRIRKGTQRYAVAGRAFVMTPIGQRRVPFVIRGAGRFGG
jgi:LEA14-like dessication related protein